MVHYKNTTVILSSPYTCTCCTDKECFADIASADIGFTDSGGFCISIKYNEGGSYFTCIPISHRDYRKDHPTKAAFRAISSREVIVYDDWGKRYNIRIESANSIEPLVKDMLEHDLPHDPLAQ